MKRFRVSVTRTDVYFVETHDKHQACVLGLVSARMEMPPDYRLDADAHAELVYEPEPAEQAHVV